MNDTTRRFLTGILDRVDAERLVELRLFPVLRQGGIESAVAVLALRPAPTEPVATTGAEEAPGAPPPRPDGERLEIVSASYRLTLKGEDRGRWELEVLHEADAPLAAVERVVQGVARRAGDAADPESFTAASLRQALDQPAWA